jgi:serine protease AprX
MNALPNDERIPVIVRRKSGFFSAQAVLPSAVAVDQAFKLIPGEALKMTAAEIEEVSKNEAIEQIWPDLPVQAWLDVSVPKIAVPLVWGAGFKGTGIKLAIIDTGIDDTHPDFAGRIKASKSFVDNSPKDGNGHGTHVAGIAAGNGAKSGGKYVGVAPEANLYIAKVLDANGSGSMSGVMAGIEWAVLDHSVQVINLSLGGSGSCDGTDALSTLCDEAVTQMGVVICVAAGNEGPGASTVGSPGCARQVITIGAVNDSDKMASFSSRGPTADGRTKPDLVFPGVSISAPQAAGTALGPVVADGYIAINGTSMATPHAAGVASLMLQANPALSAPQVKELMMAAAIDLGFSGNDQGVGRGDAHQSYLKAIDAGQPAPPPEPTPPPPDPTPPPPESPGTRSMASTLRPPH